MAGASLPANWTIQLTKIIAANVALMTIKASPAPTCDFEHGAPKELFEMQVNALCARLAVTALMISELAIAAFAQQSGDAAKGRAYAQSICAECHGVLPSDTTSRVQGVATFNTIANTPGMTDRALVVWLRTSHSNMPNLIVSGEDTVNLVAYFDSLRSK
jgi:mono/diheme cytochrome c family protein